MATVAAMALTGLQVAAQISGAKQQAAAIKAAGRDQAIIQRYQADLSEREGIVQKQQFEYVAGQEKTLAGQERASAQRKAIEQSRRGRLAASKATSQAAASGGTVQDFYGIIGGIGQESEYAKLAALFEGEDAARGLESQSALDLYRGDEAVRASKATAAGYRAGAQMTLNTASMNAKTAKQSGYISAISTVAGRATSLTDKYAPTNDTWANGDPFRTY